jgi:Flp pilus assembly protein TadB
MRIMAAFFTLLAVNVWWHPAAVVVQSAAFAALAVACLAWRSALKREQAAREALQEQDAEMQAVATWQDRKLKYMLRAERHPEDPDKPAETE